jgi:serine/threonine-protein kinase
LAIVPAGQFAIGENSDPTANPRHTLSLPDFYIDMTEVTNARFAAFVQQSGYQPRGDWRRYFDAEHFNPRDYDVERGAHPVVNIAWADADAYCRWAGRRLPTEIEWEKAARGTDGRRWPWGNTFRIELTNVETHDEGGREPDTLRVGRFPQGASPHGALDMTGNVREWTDSTLQPYPLNPATSPPAGAGSRVTRGGSWLSLPDSVEVTRRLAEPVGVTAKDLGFRCAVSPDRATAR